MKIEIKKSSKLIDYETALQFLENRVQDVINEKRPELLWILEHKSVFTAGTSYRENEILNKKIKLVISSRGGKITHHGPGQKVIYFVLNLKKREKDIKKLLNNIEKSIIKTLEEFEIKSFNDKKNIGIWVNFNSKISKVAAIGIKVKRWVAYHGFCINITNDLNAYKNIIPCGITDRNVTNLNTIKKLDYKNINEKIINNFLGIINQR